MKFLKALMFYGFLAVFVGCVVGIVGVGLFPDSKILGNTFVFFLGIVGYGLLLRIEKRKAFWVMVVGLACLATIALSRGHLCRTNPEFEKVYYYVKIRKLGVPPYETLNSKNCHPLWKVLIKVQ